MIKPDFWALRLQALKAKNNWSLSKTAEALSLQLPERLIWPEQVHRWASGAAQPSGMVCAAILMLEEEKEDA